MDVLNKRKIKRTKYPHIQFRENEDSIEILPELSEGFRVELKRNKNGYTVYFDGWHESFENQDEAIDCVGFGLSNSCRLQITMRGSQHHKWVLESNRDGEWVQDSQTGLLFYPFWRQKSIVYKQNQLIQRS